MNIPKYVGITGFTSFEQVESMLGVFKANKKAGSKRKLHVGVMMSYKTLNGIPTEFDGAFPPKELIASIFASGEAYNCLHFADYHEHGHPDLARTLVKAIYWCGCINLHAVQLDMVWPDPGEIACGTHMSRQCIQVILQIGPKAFEEIGDDPDKLVERLGDYHGAINGVLLDRSAGRGLGMDAKALLPFARAVRRSLPEFGIGVAGGLGPDTMSLTEPLIREFPGVSVEVQWKPCHSGSSKDPIDCDFAREYLVKSLQLLD